MVSVKNIILLFTLVGIVQAEEVRYFLAEIPSQTSEYRYSTKYQCSFQLDSKTLKLKKNNQIEFGDASLHNMSISSYCKQYYEHSILKKIEVVETSPFIPSKNSLTQKDSDFRELKLIKRYLFDAEGRLISVKDFSNNTRLDYYYDSDNLTIELWQYSNNSLVSIEKKYYEHNLLPEGSIQLTEGTLRSQDLLLKYSIIYGKNRKINEIHKYTYDKGVKACTYNQNGDIISSYSTFKQWVMAKNSKGEEYPKMKKVTCAPLDFTSLSNVSLTKHAETNMNQKKD